MNRYDPFRPRDSAGPYPTYGANSPAVSVAVCESCVRFGTGLEFVPVLMRQRNHAASATRPISSTSTTASLDRAKAPSTGGDTPVTTPA